MVFGSASCVGLCRMQIGQYRYFWACQNPEWVSWSGNKHNMNIGFDAAFFWANAVSIVTLFACFKDSPAMSGLHVFDVAWRTL